MLLEDTTHCMVHALEMNPAKAAELGAVARASAVTKTSAAERLVVHTVGAGAAAARVDATAADAVGVQNTYSLGPALRGRRPVALTSVDVVTLDDLYSEKIDGSWSRSLSYVKVDVEGHEPAVVRGMAALLGRRLVDIMSFEYAIFWDAEFVRLSHRDGSNAEHVHVSSAAARNDASAAARQDANAHGPYDLSKLSQSLRDFQASLHTRGYATYLIFGSDPSAGRDAPALVPISGPLWDDWYELCVHACQQGVCEHCWSDVIVLRPEAPAARRLLRRFRLRHVAPACYAPVQQLDMSC